MASAAVPEWLNKGDNAWQMLSATLVALQGFPGLALFYAGAVPRKWALTSAFMALYAMAATMPCWALWAHNMGEVETAAVAPLYPSASMVFFQWAFAGVTVGLVAGAVLGRMSVKAWMAFVPLWTTLSYTMGAYSIWGGGFLFHWGVMDYSGGYVVHLAVGVSGYTAAYWVGPRRKEEEGGGNLVGMMTGLVCITPAAGLVQGWAALLMGVASGTLPCYTMNAAADAMSFKVDDTLGILHTHAVSGVLGGVLTGVFAHPTLCDMFLPVTGSRGLIYGGVQVLKQVAWNVAATSIILLLVRAFVPLRMTEDELLAGDIAVHGEQA
uniref:Ammonium transporter AmtB-like domain-containing protein n=1 Tax=Oryza meridionalis TaxID=40149 RepID=A0A0E0F1E6_9ORYZ